jgi:hypothetical protein
MGTFAVIRRVRLPVLALLLALWGLGPIGGLLQEALHHFDHPTEVEAAVITVPESPTLRCHHHPEGCPKDCFCPKFTEDQPTPAEDAAHEHPLVREPRLVQCTEGTHQDAKPLLLALSVPALVEAPSQVLTDRGLPRFTSRLPLLPDLDSPGPVPRA